MISLSAREAFATYEAVRHRLPEARSEARRYQALNNLDDIASDFDAFLLDAFGVLNIGETAIPGTRERIDGLRAAGKRVLVVSNAASVTTSELRAKYARLGFDFCEADIITSRRTMNAHLMDDFQGTWGVMRGSDGELTDLAKLTLATLSEDEAIYRGVDGFILLGSGSWTESRQALLETALLQRPRRVLVANPDIVAPRETGFSAEPGYFAHRLADRTGVIPEFFGKPFHNIYDLAFARLGKIDRSRVLMVGDSLHTDILGAHCAGIASALVSGFGFFAGEDTGTAISSSGIVPDFVISRP